MKAKKWHEKLTEEQREIIAKYLKILSERGKQIEKTAHVISGTIRDEKTIRGLTIAINQEDFINDFLPDWAHDNCPDGWPDQKDIFRAAREYIEMLRDGWASTEPESPEAQNKPCPSISRAFGIALAMAYLNNKIDHDSWISQEARRELAEEMGAINGVRGAQVAKNIYPADSNPEPKALDEWQSDFPLDYDYALELYQRKYPD